MSDFAKTPALAVAEMQGLYGAYILSEKLLQKLWLRGDFDRHGARTVDGVDLEIVHPGRWNLLGGPDFLGARLRFGTGPVVTGDVEVHIREGDWNAHRHAQDPAYSGVVLHVVLFPPSDARGTRGAGSRWIPVVALLPLLHRSLEEYVADEVVEGLANRPSGRILEALGPLPAAEVIRLLALHSRRRWKQKVQFAGVRLRRLGWSSACHHGALEVLGFRFNRAPMLRCAGRWSLADWADGRVDPEDAFATEAGHWSLQGVRPANHPRRRLCQYAEWAVRRPEWPELLRAMATGFEFSWKEGQGARAFRREHSFGELRRRIRDDVCAGAIGGTRLDNMVCDTLLPLLATDAGCDLYDGWRHWYTGDVPRFLTDALRQLAVHGAPSEPICHGEVQGLLGWLLECESRSTSDSTPAAISQAI